MKINFSIKAEDFLTHQLYVAATSKRTIKKRKQTKLLYPLIYFTLGSIGYLLGDNVFAIIMLLMSVSWIIFYPVWERRHYYKHYKGFIDENFTDRCNVPVLIEFGKESLTSSDAGSESRLLYPELEEIVEIPTIFLLKIKGGLAFIIPKRDINVPELTTHLTELSGRLNIKYTADSNWVWK